MKILPVPVSLRLQNSSSSSEDFLPCEIETDNYFMYYFYINFKLNQYTMWISINTFFTCRNVSIQYHISIEVCSVHVENTFVYVSLVSLIICCSKHVDMFTCFGKHVVNISFGHQQLHSLFRGFNRASAAITLFGAILHFVTADNKVFYIFYYNFHSHRDGGRGAHGENVRNHNGRRRWSLRPKDAENDQWILLA